MTYTIAKVSQITGLSAHTLRYYEKEGLLRNIKRDINGNREFSDDDLRWLETITCLKNSGMSIKNLKRYIQLYTEGDENFEGRLKIIKEHKLFIEEKMKELNRYMEYVDYKIEYFEDEKKNLMVENMSDI